MYKQFGIADVTKVHADGGNVLSTWINQSLKDRTDHLMYVRPIIVVVAELILCVIDCVWCPTVESDVRSELWNVAVSPLCTV